jgi:hypothetical protein
MRYDPQREIYRDCRWCQGRGCLYCKDEADKAYKAAFPDGPKPIATFDTSTPEGREQAVDFIRKLTARPQNGGAA